ncbi:hypothetical protein H8K47_10495 [Undibacterium sp. CY7W]|uniref:Uncharacterized protein n=1 Tax=Undibacterium rugosum TaxID=2762291 RepID=A0A923I0Y8_9BURK|nr:hypothetical protein [Undibacterium rugosum]MBC3935789.1 hypothetical protein [Undibacterium rugosum]
MAVWQFTTCLVPKSWATANAGNVSLLSSDDYFDSSIAWMDLTIDRCSFDEAFDKVLGRRKAWHENQTAWGDEQRTDIQLWIEHGHIEGIQLRMNLNEDLEPFLSRFCEALDGLDCIVFVPETKQLLPLALDAIIRAALASTAASFVKDVSTSPAPSLTFVV